jgi:Arc/MetJ-type ribon-helix-helix transcriptional regulator
MKVKLNLSLEEHVVARIKHSKWESASEYITDLVQKDALLGKDALKDIHSKLDELLRRTND